jgi:hypothetical protein
LNFELLALRCFAGAGLCIAHGTALRIVIAAPVSTVATVATAATTAASATTTVTTAVSASTSTVSAASTAVSASTTAAAKATAASTTRAAGLALIAADTTTPRRLVAPLLVEGLIPCSERELRAAVHTYQRLVAALCRVCHNLIPHPATEKEGQRLKKLERRANELQSLTQQFPFSVLLFAASRLCLFNRFR